MKVYIPAIYRTKKIGGKELFCKRLADEFARMGIDVVDSKGKSYDILLSLSDRVKQKKGKVVLRLDGAYHNTMVDYKKKNKPIIKNAQRADAIIYQSNFSKRICERYLGKYNYPTAIISNGVDLKRYKEVSPVKIGYKYVFLTSSRWRPHKRLLEIIKSFRRAGIENSCLYVAGDISALELSEKKRNKYFSDDNVFYLGKLKQKELMSYIKSCDVFVHLCWVDNCPNGVVEAIAAKKTVIANNSAGTKEIVKPSGGIICNIDKEYNLKPCRLYEPPSFDYKIVSDAMKDAIENPRTINNNHVDIRKIAEKYKSFFIKVLNS